MKCEKGYTSRNGKCTKSNSNPKRIFSREPLIWFHYVLLVSVIFLAHYLSGITGVEGLVQTSPFFGWIVLFIWYYVFVSIGDQFIHKILGVD